MASPLSSDHRAFLEAARTATLATIAPDGAARLVPVCFVVGDDDGDVIVYTPLDEKPKAVADVRDLARVRDIEARPDIALLVHRWSEDWSELAWLRLRGVAALLEPAAASDEHAGAVTALRHKYPQYTDHRLEDRPMIRIALGRATSWGLSG